MRRDYTSAVRAAVNGLYEGSLDSTVKALWDVLEALDPRMAELMSENEEAARLEVNKDLDDTDDDDKPRKENVDDMLFDDEDLSDSDE